MGKAHSTYLISLVLWTWILSMSPFASAAGPTISDVRYLVAAENDWSLEDALNQNEHAWLTLDRSVINFGASSATHWYRFNIAHSGNLGSTRWLLEIAWPLLSEVDIYLIYHDANDIRSEVLLKSGFLRPPGSNYLSYRNPLVPLPLQIREQTEVVIKVRTAAFHLVPIRFIEEHAFLKQTSQQLITHGFAFGFLGVIFFYNLLLGLSSREDTFVKYAIYVAFIFIWLTDALGYRSQVVWIESLNPSFYVMSALLFFPPCISFFRSLLDLKTTWQAADRVFQLAQWLSIPLLIFNYCYPYDSILIAQIYCTLTFNAAFVVAFKRAYERDVTAAWFLVAWLTLAVAVALFQSTCLGFTEMGEEVISWVLYGVALETVLLSLIIGQRYSALKKEKSDAVQLSMLSLQDAVKEKQERLKVQEDLLRIQQNQNTILEQKVADRTADLQRMIDEKSTFLSHLSHELRSPLNGLIGLLGLIDEKLSIGELKQHTSQALGIGDYLVNLINNFLDFSKLEKDQFELECIDFNLRKIVEDCISMLEVKANQKNIQLINKVAADIPDTIKGDPTRLKQVLINLANNALKFTEQGYVAIAAARVDGKIEIAVCDTGIGIPQNKLQTIFEAYSQASADTARKYGGTGLGLDISQKLVGLMGSTIQVESTLGEGSRFYFYLPVEFGTCSPAVTISQRKQPNLPKFKGITSVLAVEDNAVNRMILTRQLQKMGISVTTAENGEQALDLLRDHTFDLVFMDVNMPVMNGLDATKAIRDRNIRGRDDLPIPIIALTGAGDEEDIQTCYRAGMDACLVKPLTESQLTSLLGQ